MNPIIDPEFHSLIPPQTPDENAGLEASIKTEGCREPLILWEDKLIDGHNRLEICRRLRLPFQTREMQFESRAHARIWIRSNQLSRRNLSDAWKLEIALGNKADLVEIGRVKLSEAGTKHQGNQHSKVEPLSNNDKPSDPEPEPILKPQNVTTKPVPRSPVPAPKHDTRAVIADTVGMSTGKVAQAAQRFSEDISVSFPIVTKSIRSELQHLV